ncbi:MAG: hypothetical protein HXX20_17200 [Chloroflexi bacterium]|nr:hypothetical protein [Chloroflexota bacterium]
MENYVISTGNTFVCPSCKQLDQVQKVTSIVSSGTSAMSTSGSTSVRVDGEMRYGSVSQTSVSTTALAYRLAPPTEPSRGFTCNGVTLWTSIAGLFICIGGASASVAFIILGLFFFVLIIVTGSRLDKPDLKFEAAMHEYHKRLATWNEMFYCYRCDGVFTKGSRFAPVANVAEFLSRS